MTLETAPSDDDKALSYHDDSDQYRNDVLEAWETSNAKRLSKLIHDLHASDIALIVGDIKSDDRIRFLKKIPNKHLIPEILVNLEDGLRVDILHDLPLSTIAKYMNELPSDDRLLLIEDFDELRQQKLLSILAPKIRNDLIDSLDFAPDTAGRIMRREFVSIPEGQHVGDVIDYLRLKKTKFYDFHNVIVHNKKFEPVGIIPAAKILTTKRDVSIADIMIKEPFLISADISEEEVTNFFRKYGLIENPVICEEGVLIGTITLDDVIELVDEQAEDDLLNLAGVGEHDHHDTVLQVARARFSWLCVNLLTAILASLAIGLFDYALEEIVALAILMPIIASMGGNAGTQSLAVTVRSLALEYLTPATRSRLIFKEIYVGLLNGVVFALLAGVIIWFWFQNIELSMVIAVAMIINLAVSTFAGTVIPLLLDHYHLDPAMGSSVLLTTITDIVGFCVFLGMASWVLL